MKVLVGFILHGSPEEGLAAVAGDAAEVVTFGAVPASPAHLLAPAWRAAGVVLGRRRAIRGRQVVG